jgi:hypothetical protein
MDKTVRGSRRLLFPRERGCVQAASVPSPPGASSRSVTRATKNTDIGREGTPPSVVRTTNAGRGASFPLRPAGTLTDCSLSSTTAASFFLKTSGCFHGERRARRFRYNTHAALGVDDATRACRLVRGIVGKRLTYRDSSVPAAAAE